MREYALSLFGMCALLGALSLIHYNKGTAERMAERVLFAAAVVLPLVNSLTSLSFSLPSIPSFSDDGEYREVIEEAFSEGVSLAVCERFSLPEGTVKVELHGFDAQKMRAEKIKITLSGVAIISDRRAIQEYIEGENLGECEVRISVG